MIDVIWISIMIAIGNNCECAAVSDNHVCEIVKGEKTNYALLLELDGFGMSKPIEGYAKIECRP